MIKNRMVALAEFGMEEEELLQLTKKVIKNKKWLYNNYEKLSNEFANKYVAIFDETVIDSDNKLAHLKEKLKKKFKNPDTILIELINPQNITLIL